MSTKVSSLSPSELYHDDGPQLRRHVRRIIKLDKLPGQDFGVRVACADNRMYVVSVARNSAAWIAGFAPGDRIDMVNKVPISGKLPEATVHELLCAADRVKIALVDNGASFLPYSLQVLLAEGLEADDDTADTQSVQTKAKKGWSFRRFSRYSRQSLAPFAQTFERRFGKKVSTSSLILGSSTSSTSSFQVQCS